MERSIAIACAAPEYASRAEALSASLMLPLAKEGVPYSLLLLVACIGLELLKPGDPQMSGAVRVDFTAGAAAFRRQQHGKELLLRACGCKGGIRPAILDATGGLGRDSFVLASAGCMVQVFEREPVLAALLSDGLSRAMQHPETATIAVRIALQQGDALSALRAMQMQKGRSVVVYLDPMFPERSKTALVKKELQLLQLVAQYDPANDAALLDAALVVACRVVVKRPAKAPFLDNVAPSFSMQGKAVRFDVYLCASE